MDFAGQCREAGKLVARRVVEGSALAVKEGKWGGKKGAEGGGLRGHTVVPRVLRIYGRAYTLARTSRITHRLVTHIQLIFR